MNEIETVIKALQKDGKSARAISTELYDRGLKTKGGKFLTPDGVEAFLRHGDAEPAKPPRVFPKKPARVPEEKLEASENAKPARDYDVRPYRPIRGKPWPPGINYGGDPDLGLNDNTHPNEPPYNYTHTGSYIAPPFGGSSAAMAVMGGT